MAAPTIYRSSDTSAPVLTGQVGSLVALLDACLVNGYGSKAAAGWTKPYTGTNQAVFRMGGGTQVYLQVDDNGPGSHGGREARCYGYNTMTSYSSGVGPFPPSGQYSVWRKSTTADATARAWILIADDKTFYLFNKAGDYLDYNGYTFGDIISLKTGDSGKALIVGRVYYGEGSGSSSYEFLMTHTYSGAVGGHYLAQSVSGVATRDALKVGFMFDIGALVGKMGYPNLGDAAVYISPIYVLDASSPPVLRGRMRGLFQFMHVQGAIGDGDTFSGSGDYAGRTFIAVTSVTAIGTATTAIIETTAWETST